MLPSLSLPPSPATPLHPLILSAAPFRPYRPPPRRPKPPHLAASAQTPATASSWSNLGDSSSNGFNGWFVDKRRDLDGGAGDRRGVVVGIAASSVVAIAAIAWCSFYRKAFRFSFSSPFLSVHEKLLQTESKRYPDKSNELNLDEKSETIVEETKIDENLSTGVKERIVVPVPADSIQLEALSVLKKLKIVEVDASADALCTKREYARWFVNLNHMLERNPKHRIIPKVWLAGSVEAAFNDVNVEDPDFFCIQSLAEVGIVSSKLTPVKHSSMSNSSYFNEEKNFFSPESFISRLDLISWKVLLEYPCSSGLQEQMLRSKTDFWDLRASPDVAAQFFVDLMVAGHMSIIRRAFGNIRCLQPHKPVTKAQAAIVLTSGRMSDAIQNELSRLEAESLSRLAEIDEIRSELIQRGDIQRFWEGKLSKERDHYTQAKKDLNFAVQELEEEKLAQDQNLVEYVKEKASLDCQQQLLCSLLEDVTDMSHKLASERLDLTAEQERLERDNSTWQIKANAVIEAKSILEAELEALRILQSWVENDALEARNRAVVLERAVQRWCYNGDFVLSPALSSASNDPKLQ